MYLPKSQKKSSKAESFKWSDGFEFYKTEVRKKLPFNLRGLKLVNAIVNIGEDRVEAISANISLFPNILTVDMSVGFDENIVSQYLPDNLKKVDQKLTFLSK